VRRVATVPERPGAPLAPRVVLGLDGCPAGWVAVVLREGRVDDVRVVASIRESIDGVQPSHVGVDMPVGLVDGPRDTDAAARALLPGRASSVFSTAARAIVEGWVAGTITTHAEASARSIEVAGAGLSQQAWRLVPKMAEVEALAAEGAALTEVHPELAFATIAGEPLPRKRSWPGLVMRRDLLAGIGIDLPTRFPGDTEAAPDDVVDAAVCAWVADGLAIGARMRRVPERTQQVAHGREIVITVREP
jgi:predicted RNase H-like nuclease